jgi:dimethylargininase
MIAIIREVSPSIAEAEVTHVERVPIDYVKAVVQHAQLAQTLQDLGCDVHALEADPRHPDCVFIEDTAVVLDEIAIITRPGAESRRGERFPVARVLASLRPLGLIEPEATLDGGDVLVVGRKIYVGQSSRTNEAAVQQLRALTLPFEYEVIPVDVRGALHLKTAVTQVAEDTLLVNPEWVDVQAFRTYTLMECVEPFGANALRIGDSVIYPNEFPRTRDKLVAAGIDVRGVDAGELAKVEGGVTCCALLVEIPGEA